MSWIISTAWRAWVGGDLGVEAHDHGAVTLTGTGPSEASTSRMGRVARRPVAAMMPCRWP
jgi:hypothetical protein